MGLGDKVRGFILSHNAVYLYVDWIFNGSGGSFHVIRPHGRVSVGFLLAHLQRVVHVSPNQGLQIEHPGKQKYPLEIQIKYAYPNIFWSEYPNCTVDFGPKGEVTPIFAPSSMHVFTMFGSWSRGNSNKHNSHIENRILTCETGFTTTGFPLLDNVNSLLPRDSGKNPLWQKNRCVSTF